ncbi:MAG TPA: hypothetical protein VME86_01235 [Acidobacteriaceae bacterium]|nr:hypothetical protein [Acidobacteriaceae bacterium]
MATHVFDSKHPAVLKQQARGEIDVEQREREFDGGAFRGFFYAMLFDVFLILLFAGAWELWHILR